MDLTLNESEAAFRDEVRAWLEANHPGREPHGRRGGLRVPPRLAEDDARGRLGRHLLAEGVRRPRRHADRAGDLLEELARADAPSPANVLGLVMGGPVVIAHGNDEQKER